jgi:hypothetical protein
MKERTADVPLMPPPDFDEKGYLEQYADVAKAVAGGRFTSGFDHYIKHGRAEGRIRPRANPANL